MYASEGPELLRVKRADLLLTELLGPDVTEKR